MEQQKKIECHWLDFVLFNFLKHYFNLSSGRNYLEIATANHMSIFLFIFTLANVALLNLLVEKENWS